LHLFLVSEHWLSGTKMQCFASEHWAIGHEDAIFCQRTLGYRARGCIGFASDNWAIGHDDAIFCQRTLGVRTQRCKVCASPRLRTEHVVANFSQRKLGYRVRGSSLLPANTGLFRARGMQSFAPQSAGHPGTECMRIRTGTGGWSESSRFADSQNPHGKFCAGRVGPSRAGHHGLLSGSGHLIACSSRSWLSRFRCSLLLRGRVFLCFLSFCFAMAPTGKKLQKSEALRAFRQARALEAAQAVAGTIQPADEARSHLSLCIA
jgi:ribosomal protein L27